MRRPRASYSIIGPGKAVIYIINHSQIIDLLKLRVFQLLPTLKVEYLKSGPQIWNRLEKLFPKMILLLKIGPGKAVISINIHSQIINLPKKRAFQLLGTVKIANLKFQLQIWNRFEKSFPKMILLLRIGPVKVVISINILSQVINLQKKRIFQLLSTLKIANLKFWLPI